MSHSEQFLADLRQELEQQREKITRELAEFSGSGDEAMSKGPRFPNRGDSEDENAQEVAEYSNRLSLSDTLEKTLRDIDNALTLMDSGTYGICKYCNQPISEARLRARPASSSCIECKKRLIGES